MSRGGYYYPHQTDQGFVYQPVYAAGQMSGTVPQRPKKRQLPRAVGDKVIFAFLTMEGASGVTRNDCCWWFGFNGFTVFLSDSDYVHVQISFVVEGGKYLHYSVDDAHPVFSYQEKTFKGRQGWSFKTLAVGAMKVRLMQEFLDKQVGKPFNRWGRVFLPFCGFSGGGKSWLCTELALATLQSAGEYTDIEPIYAVWPGICTGFWSRTTG